MNKRVLTHFIVMIIAIAGGTYFANRLNGKQMSFGIAKNAVSVKMAGFNKFASDIQWMLFVNYAGTIKSVDSSNSQLIYEKLKRIVSNDPNFEKAYEMGSLMLSVAAPEKAVEIINVGCDNPKLKSNWKLPFYAGFIVARYYPDKDSVKNIELAEKYFKTAVERSGGSEKFVISQLIRTRAKQILQRRVRDNVRVVNEKHALLFAWYDEWKLSKASMQGMDFEQPGQPGKPGQAGQPMPMGSISMIGSSVSSSIPNLDQYVLKTAQELKQMSPDDPDALKTIEFIKEKVLSGQHLCEKCLSPYCAGEKFCSKCGFKVEVFGTCPSCGAVTKDNFCTACGTEMPKLVAAVPAKAAPAEKAPAPEKEKKDN